MGLAMGAAAALVLGGARLGLAAAPKETGLPFEGLLKGRPGFQPRRPIPPPAPIADFLSRDQLGRNYAVYRAAFEELLATEAALRKVSRDAAHVNEYAALRARQVRAANSALLHEFYFRNVTANPAPPSRYVLANMSEHMGSIADWRDDFAACARAASTWAALVYDPYDDRWHNMVAGEDDAGGWAGANPLVVCDVADHAWSPEYRDRGEYIARFVEHIDWKETEARYRAVDRH